MNIVYVVETIDWSCDCIWDLWLRGVFSSKEKVDENIICLKNCNGNSKFRVLEIEIDTNTIVDGWIINVGDKKLLWKKADQKDMALKGR